jgi:hypothetical protein
LPPSRSECRFAMRPQPSRPNLIMDVFLVEPKETSERSSWGQRGAAVRA